MFEALKNKLSDVKARTEEFKKTKEYERSLYFTKQKRKLTFIALVPALVIAFFLIKYSGLPQFVVTFAVIAGLITFTSYFAHQKTKKHFGE